MPITRMSSTKMNLDFRYSLSRKFSINKQPGATAKSPSLQRGETRPKANSLPRPDKVYQPNAEEMRRVFRKFDANGDGKISKEEYKAAAVALRGSGNNAIGPDEVAKTFQAVDTDGDGFIDFAEFMEMQSQGGGIRTSDIEGAFQLYDLDGDGQITAEEMREVMKKLGESCSLESCRKMVQEFDSDGDGCINVDEFMTMMTRTLKLR